MLLKERGTHFRAEHLHPAVLPGHPLRLPIVLRGTRRLSSLPIIGINAMPAERCLGQVCTAKMLEHSGEQRDRNSLFLFLRRLLFAITRLLRFSFGHKLTLSFAVQLAALVIYLRVLAHPHQSSSLGGANGPVGGAWGCSGFARYIFSLESEDPYGAKAV